MNGTSLFNDVLSKLSQDIEFSGNFSSLGFVFLRLGVTPGGLGSEGLLGVFEIDLVVFKGFFELCEEGLGGGDKGTESSLLIGKRYLLVGEGGEEDFPISLGLLFVGGGDFLFVDDGLSDVVKEIEDLHNGFVVKSLGGELGEGRDEGLEHGGSLSTGGSELLNHLLVSGLDLSEGNSVNHMLDKLDTFFEGGNGDLGLIVLISPLLMSSVSLVGTVIDGINSLIVILLSLLEGSLSGGKDRLVIFNGGLQSSDGLFVISNLLNETSDGLVTNGLVGLIESILLSLVGFELLGNFVNQEGDFLRGVLSSHV